MADGFRSIELSVTNEALNSSHERIFSMSAFSFQQFRVFVDVSDDARAISFSAAIDAAKHKCALALDELHDLRLPRTFQHHNIPLVYLLPVLVFEAGEADKFN